MNPLGAARVKKNCAYKGSGDMASDSGSKNANPIQKNAIRLDRESNPGRGLDKPEC